MWMGHISIWIVNMTWILTVNRILNASKLKKNNLESGRPYMFALIGARSDKIRRVLPETSTVAVIFAWFWSCFWGWFWPILNIFFARHQLDNWTLALQDTLVCLAAAGPRTCLSKPFVYRRFRASATQARIHVIWRDFVGVGSSMLGLNSLGCVGYFPAELLSLSVTSYRLAKIIAKQLSMATTRCSVLSSFGVVLIINKVKFHVVRSALQYSVCRI